MSKRSSLLSAALAVCCAALLAGCGSKNNDGTTPEEREKWDTPRSTPPQELKGDWQFGLASFTNFWTDQGAYVGNAGGTSVYFTFEDDGTYKQLVYITQRQYACNLQTWTETKGTVKFEGNKFTVHPQIGRYKASDTCLTTNNFDRAMTDDERKERTETYVWRWETNPNDGKTYLMIGWEGTDLWNHFKRPQ